ncbi:MAG TPA: FCD domain-containing protein [Aliidongia sp.]|uniref:GntR family transcriptional regulator n=1 Tax=Aliidongia sp. TaxID=1914230 RepID=UPI002DDD06D4|nr:FCD domain-containing protein [Aliidongia sp.]HEV2673107.1 FCD domain-containing protein [Aliidongia sp.]
MSETTRPSDTVPRPLSVTENIRATLEELILSGAIQPGERLNELALSERFQVSRGPIREAIRALEQARLVSVAPNRGALVRKLDLADALELFDVRAGLGRTAGRLLAARASGSQLQALRELSDQLTAAVSIGSTAEFHRLNLRFHAAIMEFAGNARLEEMDVAVRNEMQLYIRDGLLGEAQLRISNNEHTLILNAIVDGDPERAGAALETHILNGKQRMLNGARGRSRT